jgi:hypothetical protein
LAAEAWTRTRFWNDTEGQDEGDGLLGIGCKEGSKGQQQSKKRNNRCSKDNHYAVASDPARPTTTYLEKYAWFERSCL